MSWNTRLDKNTSHDTPVERHISQFLDTNGDGSGDIDMGVDGDTTQTEFFIEPPAGEIYTLKKANLLIIATTFADSSKYAGQTLTEPQGIKIYVERDGTEAKNYTYGRNITTTYEWGLLAGLSNRLEDAVFSNPFNAEWVFSESGGDILLYGGSGSYTPDRFVVQINGDLSAAAVVLHVIKVQGTKTTA